MPFDLYRRDYFDKRPDRPPEPGVEWFPLRYRFEHGGAGTISAIRHELEAQGALIGGDEIFDPTLPLDFAKDCERVHSQVLQEADGWRVFPKAIRGSLAVLSEEPVTLEESTDKRTWPLFLNFLRGAAEHGGFVVT
jgi:hypothetical protein